MMMENQNRLKELLMRLKDAKERSRQQSNLGTVLGGVQGIIGAATGHKPDMSVAEGLKSSSRDIVPQERADIKYERANDPGTPSAMALQDFILSSSKDGGGKFNEDAVRQQTVEELKPLVDIMKLQGQTKRNADRDELRWKNYKRLMGNQELAGGRLKLGEKSEERRERKFGYEIGEDVKTKHAGIIKDFNKSIHVRDTIKAVKSIKKIRNIVETNGKLAPSVVIRLLARIADETGVMTDQDVNSFRGSLKWTDALERWYHRGLTGTLTDTDKQAMLTMVDNIEKIEYTALDAYADNVSHQYSKAYGYDPAEIKGMIFRGDAVSFFNPESDGSGGGAAGAGGVKMMLGGKEKTVPANRVDAFKKLGAKEVEGGE